MDIEKPKPVATRPGLVVATPDVAVLDAVRVAVARFPAFQWLHRLLPGVGADLLVALRRTVPVRLEFACWRDSLHGCDVLRPDIRWMDHMAATGRGWVTDALLLPVSAHLTAYLEALQLEPRLAELCGLPTPLAAARATQLLRQAEAELERYGLPTTADVLQWLCGLYPVAAIATTPAGPDYRVLASPAVAGPGYRLLRRGDMIQPGDQAYTWATAECDRLDWVDAGAPQVVGDGMVAIRRSCDGTGSPHPEL
jgi:hypothetical protein